jgi:subtilisin family serine protease
MGAADQVMQFDPALKHAVLARTGHTWDETTAVDEIAVVARMRRPDEEVPGLRVVARLGSIVTGRVEIGRIAQVRAHPNIDSLKASRTVSPSLAWSVPAAGASDVHAGREHSGDTARPALSITGRGVLVAVLDWHCDFGHSNFRDAGGHSRLRWLWDQRGGATDRSPSPFGYGRVFEQAEFDAALDSADPYAAIDYDPARSDPGARGSHGTHVLDIAAGNGRAAGASVGMAPGADLGFVHLRADDTSADDNLGDSVRLLEAVRFVFDRAGETPCVINMSLGSHGGPHDGTTLVELGLDQILAERPGRAITMSTGNYFQTRTHAREVIAQDQTVEFGLSVGEGLQRPIEIEVWYSGDDVMRAQLVDPSGRVVLDLPLGAEAQVRGAAGPVATGYHRARDPNNADHVIDVFVWPSAQPGRWVLAVHGAWVTRGRLDAWIERDDRGPQGRFARGRARQTGTTGTICNGRNTIAVGAHDPRQGPRGVGRFSSCGPTRDGRRKPDLAAPGTAILAARSTVVHADGTRSWDGLTTKSGTSMASPHVCGAVALVFEAASPRRLSIEQTRRIILGAAQPVVGAPPIVHMRLGHGRLDARAAVAAARVLTTSAAVAGRRGADVAPPHRPSLDDLRRALAWIRPVRAIGSPENGDLDVGPR